MLAIGVGCLAAVRLCLLNVLWNGAALLVHQQRVRLYWIGVCVRLNFKGVIGVV